MTSPEQSLDLKAYLAGFQTHWTITERRAHVEAHPAEHAEHLEWIRQNPRPEERRRKDRNDLTGVNHVNGSDGKVYPSGKHLPYEVWNQILEMHRDGYSMRKIATAVGCSVGTAHRIAKNYRLTD